MENEQIKKIAEMASGNISVFLGAGASAAAGLPTMVSFLDNAYGTAERRKLSHRRLAAWIATAAPTAVGSGDWLGIVVTGS
jgi:NAD-dependent SIR2 family protein deacetylase